MRGFFHGASDVGESADAVQLRLHSVSVPVGSPAVGRSIGELRLDELGVSVSAVRRRNIRGLSPGPETRIMEGDVVVLMGVPTDLELAEARLLRGE
jgi:CPA2 family monovalent cation:H+ antiporter-2